MTSLQEHKIRRPLNRQVLNGSQGIGPRVVSGVCSCRFAGWRVMGQDPHYIGGRYRHNTRYSYDGEELCEHATSRFSVDFILICCYGQVQQRWGGGRSTSLSFHLMNKTTLLPRQGVRRKVNNMNKGCFSLHRPTFPSIISLVLMCTAYADDLADKESWMNNHKTKLWNGWIDVSPDAGVGFLTRNVAP